MKEIIALVELFGEKDSKVLKKRIMDILMESFKSDVESYCSDNYLFDGDLISELVSEAVEEAKEDFKLALKKRTEEEIQKINILELLKQNK